MKRYLILLIGLTSLTLSSFGTETSKVRNYKVTCPGGAVYYFQCSCDLNAAQDLGDLLCAFPVSEP